jgi:hypothetical protein
MIRTLTNSFEARHANTLHYEAMKKGLCYLSESFRFNISVSEMIKSID